MSLLSDLKGTLVRLFRHEAEAEAAPVEPQLTEFEQELSDQYVELYNTGHIAFLVVLIPDENGPLGYYKHDQLVHCRHDYFPIRESGNPHKMMEICKNDNLPVLMALDIQSREPFKNMMPEGWTPGTLNIDSELFYNRHIRLRDEESYGPKKVMLEIDENTDTYRLVAEPVEDKKSQNRPKGPPTLRLVVNNPNPRDPQP